MTSWGPLLGVAALRGEERRCLKALKEMNATSPENAIGVNKISKVTSLPIDRVISALQRLKKCGKIQKTAEGKYFAICKGKYC